ncbi:tata box-binding protein-associated factor rna polymerase i subunit b [Holotrichia oblita]|uniref:Tata box-binding protein-associated factor rna polymerase i subunit b n=1 Tax=Holotrichia oblita TaxID=644536 RepID=A0ACB9T628_HOLOL|nr:tata box-binding protein-associated factor rna polymerase i subunit b [Holotrichia oblita]
MAGNVACDLCGGTDFYCDSGFYYCTECQRQTQDIQERVLEGPEEVANLKKSKKVTKKSSEEKKEDLDRLTSWECYNYIVFGLVNELTELGASDNYKGTVEVLWFQYLKLLGVVRSDGKPPLLPALNAKEDAEIIYGRKIPKKRRIRKRSRDSHSSTTDMSSLDEASLKRERTRRRRALARAKHDEAVTSTQRSDASVLSQSLGTLRSSHENEAIDENKILRYHTSAVKELRKTMTKTHFRHHCRDVNSTLTCHKPSYKKMSDLYLKGPYVITRMKIISILYLGLVINKENIQLSDMLRYIREGHLSFHYCNHFFPEEVVEKDLNICTFNHGQIPLGSLGVRTCALQIATELNVKKYIPVPNLVELSKRYCNELNLPDEIHRYILNLLSRTQPKMSVYDNPKFIPNYEARVMSFIIIVLKLLFCLDEATEFELSNLASAIEEYFPNKECKPFNFIKWLKHIEYRKLILAETHFPTQHLNDDYKDPGKFIGFMNWVNERVVDDEKLPLDMELIKDQLDLIKNTVKFTPDKFNYNCSLTPYRDYVKQLLNSESKGDNYFIDILSADFSSTSLEYLNQIESYKQALLPQAKLEVKHGGKNDNFKIMLLYNHESERFRKMRLEKREVKVTFARNDKNKKITNYDGPPIKKFKQDTEKFFENFEQLNQTRYKRNKTKLSKQKIELELPQNLVNNLNIDNVIYNPSERYWCNFQSIGEFTIDELKEFFDDLPRNFRTIFKECARIIEQTEKDLWMEYCLTEAYLSLVFNPKNGRCGPEQVIDVELKKLIQKAKKMW